MNKMKSQTRNRLLLLLLVASLSGLLYLMPMDYPLTGFIMKLRSQKLLAYLLVAITGGLATISFQTITENRFLTPSILGMESLYVFMQTIYLFFASKFIGNTGHPLLEFILVLLIQCGFFFCLQPALKKLLQQGFVFILLICMALGTLFRSASIFLQVLMDPNEYDKLQTKLFPSFQRMNMDILSVAAIIIGLAGLYLLKKNAILNVFHLDKKTTTILGVEVEKEQKKNTMGNCFADFNDNCSRWTYDVLRLYDVQFSLSVNQRIPTQMVILSSNFTRFSFSNYWANAGRACLSAPNQCQHGH